MEGNNIRTMELIGEDDFGNEVYKCIETGTLYKNLGIEGHNPVLYGCGNAFDGEPSFPIDSNFEIRFKETVKKISEEQKFNYLMLGRLKSDCEYYLGYGNRQVSNLWAGSEQEQISKMKQLYNSFPSDEKPEWLTYNQILEYEKLMVDSELIENNTKCTCGKCEPVEEEYQINDTQLTVCRECGKILCNECGNLCASCNSVYCDDHFVEEQDCCVNCANEEEGEEE